MTEIKDKSPKNENTIKNFFQKFRENWLWVNIGGIIANTIFLWVFYSYGIINFGYTIAFTLLYPLIIILVVLIRRAKNPPLCYKIVGIGIGGFVIADIIWLLSISALLWQPWSPLFGVFSTKARIWFYITTFLLLYTIVMITIYLIGKKKGWKYRPLM